MPPSEIEWKLIFAEAKIEVYQNMINDMRMLLSNPESSPLPRSLGHVIIKTEKKITDIKMQEHRRGRDSSDSDEEK